MVVNSYDRQYIDNEFPLVVLSDIYILIQTEEHSDENGMCAITRSR
jgi:hypothetical protein